MNSMSSPHECPLFLPSGVRYLFSAVLHSCVRDDSIADAMQPCWLQPLAPRTMERNEAASMTSWCLRSLARGRWMSCVAQRQELQSECCKSPGYSRTTGRKSLDSGAFLVCRTSGSYPTPTSLPLEDCLKSNVLQFIYSRRIRRRWQGSPKRT